MATQNYSYADLFCLHLITILATTLFSQIISILIYERHCCVHTNTHTRTHSSNTFLNLSMWTPTLSDELFGFVGTFGFMLSSQTPVSCPGIWSYRAGILDNNHFIYFCLAQTHIHTVMFRLIHWPSHLSFVSWILLTEYISLRF